MHLLLLLLFFFLSVSVSSDTQINISGNVICNNATLSPFQYRLKVLEYDFITTHDTLYTSGVQYGTSPAFYNLTTSDGSDEMTGSYEIVFEVLHTCNSKVRRNVSEALFLMGELEITHGTHVVIFDIDVTDQGVAYELPIERWTMEEIYN